MIARVCLLLFILVYSITPTREFDLKVNLVAEHSRKTFRPGNDNEEIDALLTGMKLDDGSGAIPSTPIHDQGIVLEPLRQFTNSFSKSARVQMVHEVDTNYFKKLWFDPSYKIHDLCSPEKSGHQTGELVWTEPGDLLLKVIGNGVVKDGYNMFMAPGQVEGKATQVHVALYIESMSSFKALTMDFEVDMYLAMSWFDRRLSHNCTHPILVTSKIIAERMWAPDLYFVNSKFAYLQEVTTPNHMVIVYPDGLVFKTMRLDVTLSCMMDLQLFPMDYQRCPLTIQSFAYIEQIVNLTWHVDKPYFPIGYNLNIKLNDMMLKPNSSNYERCSGLYPMFRGAGNWSCIQAFIVMQRLVLFHVIQTYIPTGMLVLVSQLSFWLDPRASPARISLTITSLLTLTTMSNGARQDLPQVAYVKAIDVWLTFSQALIFLVLLEYSFVSYFISKRVFECVHRRAFFHHRLHSQRSNQNNKSPPPALDDERIRLSGDELTEASFPFAPVNIPPPSQKKSKKQQFSLTSGLSTMMGQTANLCRMRSDKHRRNAEWLEAEAEHTALMSATPHAAAHVYEKFDFNKPCLKCSIANEKIARRIDRNCRWIFPLIFLIFTVCYWGFFSYISQQEAAAYGDAS